MHCAPPPATRPPSTSHPTTISGRPPPSTGASIASDSQLAELRIATEAEIAAYTAQLEAAQIEPAPPREPGSGAAPPPPASSLAVQPRVAPGSTRAGRGVVPTTTPPGPAARNRTPGARASCWSGTTTPNASSACRLNRRSLSSLNFIPATTESHAMRRRCWQYRWRQQGLFVTRRKRRAVCCGVDAIDVRVERVGLRVNEAIVLR